MVIALGAIDLHQWRAAKAFYYEFLSGGLAMKTKVQSKSKAEQLTTHESATLIFGLAMTTLFVGMLILNAIS